MVWSREKDGRQKNNKESTRDKNNLRTKGENLIKEDMARWSKSTDRKKKKRNRRRYYTNSAQIEVKRNMKNPTRRSIDPSTRKNIRITFRTYVSSDYNLFRLCLCLILIDK